MLQGFLSQLNTMLHRKVKWSNYSCHIFKGALCTIMQAVNFFLEPEDAVRYWLLFHLVDTHLPIQICHCIKILLLRFRVFKQVMKILILHAFLS